MHQRLRLWTNNPIPLSVLVLAVLLATTTIGCKSLDTEQMMANLLPAPSVRHEDVVMHRRRFQQDRTSADFRWLLANATRTGMSPKDVGEVLGESGQKVMNDTWIKSSGGHYRASDEVYKWGPDDEGKTVYLIFRDNQLVNFDPSEFQS